MADTSLDDFFAKKDKNKKSKNKGRLSGADQVTKKSDDGSKKSEKASKKDKEKNVSSGTAQSIINTPSQEQVQEEWNEVDDEEKDYSSLRIQALTLDKEKEEEFIKDQLAQENGVEAHSADGLQGPWKKSNVSSDADTPDGEKDDDDNEIEEEVSVAQQPEAPSAPGKYVPPSLRRAQMSGPVSNSSMGRRYNKSVPEMTSELHFPSLSSAIDPSPKGARSQMNDRSFQSVKHGSRYKDDLSQSGVHLDLENKYSALRRSNN